MNGFATPRQPIHLSVVAMVTALIVVTFGSLVPFLPPDRNLPVPATLADALRLPFGALSTREIIVHVAMFLPLGLLTAWSAIRVGLRQANVNPLPASMAFLFAFALILEWMQARTQTRHAAWLDVAVNTLAAGAGAMIAIPFFRHRNPWRTNFAKYDRRLAVILVAAGNVALLTALVRVHTGATLDNWDDGFPLVLANEATGDRPWHGTIAGLAIYDRALSRDEVADRSRRAFSDAAARSDAVALYDFSGTAEPAWNGGPTQPAAGADNSSIRSKEPLPDGRGSEKAGAVPQSWMRRFTNRAARPTTLNWTAPDSGAVSFDGLGLAVGGSAVVRTDAPPVEICESVRASRAFTIETSVLPANLNQDGPARIVSLSADPFRRNISVSQSRAEIDLRVRTPRTGLNGYLIPMRTTGGVLARGWHHVAVVNDRGRIRLYVDGPPARIDIDLSTVSTMIFRRQWFGSEVLAAVVLFLPISLMASVPWIHRRGAAAIVIGSASVAVLPLIAFAAAAVAHGREIAWSFMFAAIAAAAAGVTFGRALHPFSPSPASEPARASADTAT